MKYLIMMSSKLRLRGGILALAWLVLPSAAYAVTFVEQPDVFTPDVWLQPTANETYYGELGGWPHTFNFYLTESTPLTYTLAVRPGAKPVTLLLVREENRGVSEVSRLAGANVTWRSTRDARLSLTIEQAESLQTTLTPGSYKLEISNPENQGRYQLAVGTGSSGGFWQSLVETFQVHAFYGSWYTALLSWRVWLLVGIILIASWWIRRKL